MLTYLKIVGAGIICASLLILGWKANGWRIEASNAELLRVELRNELQRRVKADAERLTYQRKFEASQARVVEKVKLVKNTVTKYVKINPMCDLPEPVASQLQQLREGDVP